MYSRTSKILVCVALCLGGLVLPLWSDRIILKNGNQLDGEILRRQGPIYKVRLPYGVMEIHQREIARIQETSRISNLLVQGEQMLYHKRFDLALAQFREALDQAPDDRAIQNKLQSARFSYADFLHQVKRYDDALDMLRIIVKDNPAHTEAQHKIQAITHFQAQFLPGFRKAKILLGDGHYAKARPHLLQLWSAYPTQRKALRPHIALTEIVMGDAKLRVGAYAEASDCYEQALVYDPDAFPKLVNRYTFTQSNIARAHLNNHEYKDAEKIIRKSLTYLPGNQSLRYMLGYTLQKLGHFQEAIKILEKLEKESQKKFDPKKSFSLHSQLAMLEAKGKAQKRASRDTAKLSTIQSDHFKVRCPSKKLGRQVSEALEYHFQEMAPVFDLKSLPKPCDVLIHQTKQRFHNHTRVAKWSEATSAWRQRFGQLQSLEIHSYQGSPQLLSSKLRHELTHILLATHAGYANKVPLWAHEGFAVSSEPSFKHKYYVQMLVDAARQQNLLPLETILNARKYPGEDKVKRFYAQSFSLVQFLIARTGFEEALALVKDLSRSNSWAPWEKHTRFSSVKQLENMWLRKAVKPLQQ